MKKIIIPLLATALLFTACSQQETTVQLEKSANIEVSSFNTEKTKINVKRREYISSITVDNMLSQSRLSALKTAGINAEVRTVEENADSTLNITLALTNNKGRTLLLPVTAMLDYYNSYGDIFHGEKLYWGSLNVQDDEIILTTLNDIYIVDAGKLKLKETVFDTGSLTDSDFYLGDTIKKDDDYITCFYKLKGDKNGFLIFNSDGSLKQFVETDYNFLARNSKPSENEPYFLDLDTKTELFFINKEETLVAERDDFGGGYVCDLHTGEFFYYRNSDSVKCDKGRTCRKPRTSGRHNMG